MLRFSLLSSSLFGDSWNNATCQTAAIDFRGNWKYIQEKKCVAFDVQQWIEWNGRNAVAEDKQVFLSQFENTVQQTNVDVDHDV